MKIVLAFDSFKGSATAEEIGEAVNKAIMDVMPTSEVCVIPIADGGEGTVAAIAKVGKGDVKWVECSTFDPLMRPIRVSYAMLEDGKVAAIELAAASGLPLVEQNLRNPLETTTYGTGILIKNALDHGCENFIIGLGGSATNDGGMGLLSALGYKFIDSNKCEVRPIGKELPNVVEIDDTAVDERLARSHFTVACDVVNPLVGENGAAYVFAPQKGADIDMVQYLDDGLESFASVLNHYCGKDISLVPGAGAAGGVGGGMLALLNATLKSGSKIILEMAHFSSILSDADYVITGEGRIDSQSSMGKAVGAVIEYASRMHVPVIGLAGAVDMDNIDDGQFAAIVSIQQAPVAIDVAMGKHTTLRNVYFTARQVAKLIKVVSDRF